MWKCQHGKGYNPRRSGTGGSQYPDLPAEFSKLPHDRGTLGAARSQNPNSANSQFFINFKDNHFLNGQYTVYGRVISGDGACRQDHPRRAAGQPRPHDHRPGGRRCRVS
jgi:cyclophilin family peptidyl-prolyl cis-trans isomerase